jgi:hypothetical protein
MLFNTRLEEKTKSVHFFVMTTVYPSTYKFQTTRQISIKLCTL